MKTHRAHRRKLRFAPIKDAASEVPVKIERAPERPIKRRKRQPRPRRVSPAPTRHENGLPAATWSNIQEQFAAAKSLGEITRIVLQFLTEHEHLQGTSPVFPIFVPSSEIYTMKGRTCTFRPGDVCPDDRYVVPRKRRIYDVLHVLEGIKVIKRVRYDERRRTNGGYFLYYGRTTVVQHLAEMKSNSAQVMTNFRKSRLSKRISLVEEDSALIRVFEDQAAAGKWPCLVNMTVCFLGLLFQQDYQTEVRLPTLSARLGEAKQFIGTLLPSSSVEAPYRDVHRRVYDVVSVLVSCNLIATSSVRSSEPMDKGLRKYVRFNYDIFTDPRILFGAPDSVEQWNDDANDESMFGDMVASLCDLKSPKLEVLGTHLVSPPLTYWQHLLGEAASVNSPVFSPVAIHPADTSSKTGLKRLTYNDLPCNSGSPETGVRCREPEKPARHIQDFFSPLIRLPTKKSDWYDESLKHLGLYDALPAEDKIDWELNNQLKENYREMWGCQYPGTPSAYTPMKAQAHPYSVGRMETKVADLKYREILDDDIDGITTNFFC
ncbi:hypothetical protein GN244_ATG00372 [Phytophthora infestans]|uniref:E2F/DP family winged-helix DNA-binding domain-containing protein n=1 Tax=Phytophthora infestans TaxID=4787 RepID=A0A833WNS6_PHYIN|nr:hypothetical protein GN244_ATG00372 [Phytophthora infestans]